MYFLDSDTCINLLRGKLPATYEMMKSSTPSMFGVPAIVEAELRTGALKSDQKQKNQFLLERFLAPFERIPFDSTCAGAYAKIRAHLEAKGTKIGPNDLLIAATAIAHGAILITGNTREFKRVPGLEIEEWDEVEL